MKSLYSLTALAENPPDSSKTSVPLSVISSITRGFHEKSSLADFLIPINIRLGRPAGLILFRLADLGEQESIDTTRDVEYFFVSKTFRGHLFELLKELVKRREGRWLPSSLHT
jgi:hypothetical protein